MEYKKCTDSDKGLIFQAFEAAFTDYIIQIKMTKEDFLKRFFGPEGNKPEHSFLALDNGTPVGVTLGGIKIYEGRKTMRMGGMGVVPSYRGRGVSKVLFDLHRREALDQGCDQLFLEVITQNKMGVAFYKRMGYKKVYDLHYFDLKDLEDLKQTHVSPFKIEEMGTGVLKTIRAELKGLHVNWQNDVEYMEKLEDRLIYGIGSPDQPEAAICINKGGKIYALWVEPKHRMKGRAKALLAHCAQTHALEKMSCSFANNADLEMLMYRLGFKKDKLTQYEMYLALP